MPGEVPAEPVRENTVEERTEQESEMEGNRVEESAAESVIQGEVGEMAGIHPRCSHIHTQPSNGKLERELERKDHEMKDLRQEVNVLRKQLLVSKNSEMYPMNTHPPHGKAIVIVNNMFTPNPDDPTIKLLPRPGAECDVFLFKSTFEHLQYEVDCYTNLTCEEMYQVFYRAAKESHEANDSFVCCISSHGDENVIYGTDSVGVRRSELIQIVKRSMSLRGKPKLFFLQACRTKSSSAAGGARLMCLPETNLPEDADVYIANASTVNYASYRNHKRGSWFVMALHHVFTRHGDHLTLDQMMHKVNSLVYTAQGIVQDNDPGNEGTVQHEARQCAETTSSFRMDLRFKPAGLVLEQVYPIPVEYCVELKCDPFALSFPLYEENEGVSGDDVMAGTAKYFVETKCMLEQGADLHPRVPGNLYPLDKNPHGVCLIINNHRFYHDTDPAKAHPDRGGAEIDQYNLTQTFSYLHYKVEVRENLTNDQMTDAVMRMSQRDHSNYDSFICCILSHGEHEIIYGANSKPVNVNDLTGVMKLSATLRNKPKLFFVCHQVESPEGSTLQLRVPHADFFICYGKAMDRSHKHGSWFMSELCRELALHSYHTSLRKMVCKVKQQISAALREDDSISYADSLQKDVHFFSFVWRP